LSTELPRVAQVFGFTHASTEVLPVVGITAPVEVASEPFVNEKFPNLSEAAASPSSAKVGPIELKDVTIKDKQKSKLRNFIAYWSASPLAL
jgi:hypothetical protein